MTTTNGSSAGGGVAAGASVRSFTTTGRLLADRPWTFRVFGAPETSKPFGLAADCTDRAAGLAAGLAADREADTADATAASTAAAFKRLALTLSATTRTTANTRAKNATASAVTVTSSSIMGCDGRTATQYPHFFKGRPPTASAWPTTASAASAPQQSPP